MPRALSRLVVAAALVASATGLTLAPAANAAPDPPSSSTTNPRPSSTTTTAPSTTTTTRPVLGESDTITASPNPAKVGDTITVTQRIENPYIWDSEPWFEFHFPASFVGCNPDRIGFHEHTTCTFTHVVQSWEAMNGWVQGDWAVQGSGPWHAWGLGGGYIHVPITGTPDLAFTTTANPAHGLLEGDVVTYTYDLTNSGDIPFRAVALSTGLPGDPGTQCSSDLRWGLFPGNHTTCTAQYTVTAADVAAGSLITHASAQANSFMGAVIRTADVTVSTGAHTSFDVTVTADPASGLTAGQSVRWRMVGRNSGDVTLTNVDMHSRLGGMGSVGCTGLGTRAPGQEVVCSGTSPVTQADVDAGSITNVVTVGGVYRDRLPVSGIGQATATTVGSSSITLTERVDPSANVHVGDTLTYDYVARNTGTRTLHDAAIADDRAGRSPLACDPGPPATLAPDATLHCTATYVATQADVDAGSIVDTATVGAVDPRGETRTATASATATTDAAASMSFTQTATPDAGVQAGDTVTYFFTGTNTGSVSLHGVELTDERAGLSGFECTPAMPATLAADATISCAASTTVTQADVDAGAFTNHAVITGFDPRNNTISATSSATVTASEHVDAAFTKTVEGPTPVVTGSELSYTFVATNGGHRTLHDARVTDPMPGLSTPQCEPAAPATLAPGVSMRCTARKTVTLAEVDAGVVANTARFDATVGGLPPIVREASASIATDRTATVALRAAAEPTTDVRVGDKVSYRFHASNPGAVTLRNVELTDPMVGLSELQCEPALPATLAPGATIECTATYRATQADVDAGHIETTVSVTGTGSFDQPVHDSARVDVTTDPTATIALIKTADPVDDLAAGDRISYTFTGRNTGSVSLHDVTLTDQLPGLSAPTCTPTAPATLAAGESITCNASYTVTQADVDANRPIVNHATISGRPPSGDAVEATADARSVTSQVASLSLAKTASPEAGLRLGEQVAYTFAVTNTGTLTVQRITVTDPLAGMTPITCLAPTPFDLAPGQTTICTATYTVTQADVDAGAVVNTATATGNSPTDQPVTTTGSATVAVNRVVAASITKVAHAEEPAKLGATITYDVHARNTGTVNLHDVVVADPLPGLTDFACVPAVPVSLAPGDGIDCTATYTVTQADLNEGRVTNAATVTGHDLYGIAAQDSATANTITDSVADITLSKSASPTTGVGLGEQVDYTFVATNSGTVDLRGVAITDPMPGLAMGGCIPGAGSSLAPGATMTCGATYLATEPDVVAGKLHNTAMVSGLDVHAHEVSAEASETILAGETASIAVTQTADPSTEVVAGDIVTLAVDITNGGTAPLHQLELANSLTTIDPEHCDEPLDRELAPSHTVRCITKHTVSQDEVDAGSFANVAAVKARGPFDHPVAGFAATTVTARQHSEVGITAALRPHSDLVAGEQVRTRAVITNTGTIPLRDLTVTNSLIDIGSMECAPHGSPPSPTPTVDALAPGASATCTADYTVTVTDVDTGQIDDVVAVNGTSILGTPVHATETTHGTTRHEPPTPTPTPPPTPSSSGGSGAGNDGGASDASHATGSDADGSNDAGANDNTSTSTGADGGAAANTGHDARVLRDGALAGRGDDPFSWTSPWLALVAFAVAALALGGWWFLLAARRRHAEDDADADAR